MTRSLFISLEGPDGGGKSTQSHLLAAWLRQNDLPVRELREPGGTPVGERVREIMFAPQSDPVHPVTMALLMAASRAQLVRDVIQPALHAGQVVIVDRYADSTLAYQGYGQQLDLDDMRTLVRLATDGLRPDLTLYLDVPVAVGEARMAGRVHRTHLDEESRVFHERVRAGYETLMAEERNRWIRIDATDSVDAVHSAILAAVAPRLVKAQTSQ